MSTVPENSGNRPFSFLTQEGEDGYETLLGNPGQAVFATDFDRTMAEGCQFPELPDVDPDYPVVLGRLAERFGAMAILTGRSVQQLDQFGLLVPGVHAVGQFGCEHYYRDKHTQWVEPPRGLSQLKQMLPGALEEARVAGVSEEGVKNCFYAVHYPAATGKDAERRLHHQLARVASQANLAFLPGSCVVEMGARVDKELSLHRFVFALGWIPSVLVYAGDSWGGDGPAFRTLEWYRRLGVHTVKVCASNDQALLARADIKVSGPRGMLALLKSLA